MKFELALALVVGQTVAQSTTNNECSEEQDAVFVKNCYDQFFERCHQYQLDPDGTCNVYTFSRSGIKFYTSQINVLYWRFAEEDDGTDDNSNSSGGFDDFGGFKAKLQQGNDDEDRVDWDTCLQAQ